MFDTDAVWLGMPPPPPPPPSPLCLSEPSFCLQVLEYSCCSHRLCMPTQQCWWGHASVKYFFFFEFEFDVCTTCRVETCLASDAERSAFFLAHHWRMLLVGNEGAGMFNHWDTLHTSSFQAQVRAFGFGFGMLVSRVALVAVIGRLGLPQRVPVHKFFCAVDWGCSASICVVFPVAACADLARLPHVPRPQIAGRKRWHICAPDQAAFLYRPGDVDGCVSSIERLSSLTCC